MTTQLRVIEVGSPLPHGMPNGGEQIWLTASQCRELAAELLARAARISP